MRFVLAGVCFFPDAAPALYLVPEGHGPTGTGEGHAMDGPEQGSTCASQLEARRWVCEEGYGYPPNQKRCNFPRSWQATLELDRQQLSRWPVMNSLTLRILVGCPALVSRRFPTSIPWTVVGLIGVFPSL